MNKLGKYLLAICFCTLATFSWGQYQMHLSQYNMHQAFLNPAATAGARNVSAALFYKNQWTGFDGAPSFVGLNVHTPFNDHKQYVGLTVLNDNIGATNALNVSGSYAYKLRVNQYEEDWLSFALTADLVMLNSDFSSLNVTDASDPVFSSGSQSHIAPNFKFGTFFKKDRFFAGLAIQNLLHNRTISAISSASPTTFDMSAMHYYVHGGYKVKFSPVVDVTPSILIKQVSGAPMQVDFNLEAMIRKKIGAGVSLRTGKILNLMMSMKANKQVRVGYSFNYNFSELSTFSSGSHELMITFRVPGKKEKPSVDGDEDEPEEERDGGKKKRREL